MSRGYLLFALMFLAFPVIADDNLYICEAEQIMELDDKGLLAETDFAKAISMHQARFAVDRETGVVAGGPFATVDAKDVQILSSGDDQEALKILWLAQAPYAHLKYLWVRSYAEGEKKPFLGVSGNVVITGNCE
jgi:hypothetical protein